MGKNVYFDRHLIKYTTFQVGGPCEALYEADNEDDLKNIIAYVNEHGIPYFVIGRGSNLLVKDEGLEGLVILLKGALSDIREEGETILAGGGLFLSDLLTFCRDRGLSGLEWSAGIPGTLGGAVNMNAGAHGEEFGKRVLEIHGIDSRGESVIFEASQLIFSYRCLEMPKGLIITRVRLKLAQDTRDNVKRKISEYLKKRKSTQPLEFPNAGSVFKNPPGHHAGVLIETAGLKGTRSGGAMISEKHANFIINMKGATAQDILDLIHLAKTTVKKKTGIDLEPEIRIIGKG